MWLTLFRRTSISGPKPSDLYGRFTWKIENFSTINKRELRSNAFEVGGYKWYETFFSHSHFAILYFPSFYRHATRSVLTQLFCRCVFVDVCSFSINICIIICRVFGSVNVSNQPTQPYRSCHTVSTF